MAVDRDSKEPGRIAGVLDVCGQGAVVDLERFGKWRESGG